LLATRTPSSGYAFFVLLLLSSPVASQLLLSPHVDLSSQLRMTDFWGQPDKLLDDEEQILDKSGAANCHVSLPPLMQLTLALSCVWSAAPLPSRAKSASPSRCSPSALRARHKARPLLLPLPRLQPRPTAFLRRPRLLLLLPRNRHHLQRSLLRLLEAPPSRAPSSPRRHISAAPSPLNRYLQLASSPSGCMLSSASPVRVCSRHGVELTPLVQGPSFMITPVCTLDFSCLNTLGELKAVLVARPEFAGVPSPQVLHDFNRWW
jgi:hypothetical protein